jgi:transposase InsO family protein
MGWQEASIVDQRREFVELAKVDGTNISALCRRFGISRQTGYKWIRRSREGANLEDRSKRPKTSPKRTDEPTQAKVLDLRDRHPAWGGRKLRTRLLKLGEKHVPAASTITEILRRHQRLDAQECQGHAPFVRFERERPNELWQMDFKGHVPLHVGGRCHPLTVLDDHSRYAIGLRACLNEQRETVQEELIALFRRYGLPERILCDNGPPWAVPQGMHRHTRLSVWLLLLGVGVSHGRPKHPQTQGKDERFHRTLNAELLSRRELRDKADAQVAFDVWRDVYNLERPSEAIGMEVPAARYRPSEREYPEKLPKLEFSPEDDVRKVKGDGAFYYLNRPWYIGEAFANQHVGVRETAAGMLEARLGPHVVGEFDPANPPVARTPKHPVYRMKDRLR